MGIPVTTESRSLLRSSLQLLVIKNGIKTTAENEIEIYSKHFYENIKTSV